MEASTTACQSNNEKPAIDDVAGPLFPHRGSPVWQSPLDNRKDATGAGRMQAPSGTKQHFGHMPLSPLLLASWLPASVHQHSVTMLSGWRTAAGATIIDWLHSAKTQDHALRGGAPPSAVIPSPIAGRGGHVRRPSHPLPPPLDTAGRSDCWRGRSHTGRDHPPRVARHVPP